MKSVMVACLVLVGCGSPFVDGIRPPPGDASAGDDAVLADAVFTPEAGRHDADLPDNVTADHLADASPPLEAGPPDVLPPPVDVGCSPEAPGVHACPGGAAAATPGYFCVYFPVTSMAVTPGTPSACQCSVTYTCACILAATPDVCGPGWTASCSDGASGPTITCS